MSIDILMNGAAWGANGESNITGYTNWIEILSSNWGATQPSSKAPGGAGHGSGLLQFDTVTVSKYTDSSSPKLWQKMMSGTVLPSVEIHDLYRTGDANPIVYQKVILTNAYIKGIHAAGASSGDGKQVETIEIAFTKFEFDYNPQKDDNSQSGFVSAIYDLTTGVQS